MSVREIYQSSRTASSGHKGDLLGEKTVDVTAENLDEARSVAQDLLDTMAAQPLCVGLAANQIGSPLRVAVIQAGDEALVLVNPQLTSTSGKKDKKRESCMSVWGLTGEVERRSKAAVAFRDLQLQVHDATFEGFVARIVQHEIDHLDGVLYLEHVTGEPSATELFEGYSPLPQT